MSLQSEFNKETTSKVHELSLEKEKLRVLRFSRKTGGKFSYVMFTVGAFLLLSALYTTMITNNLPSNLTFTIIVFLGVTNVLSGLLLLACSH